MNPQTDPAAPDGVDQRALDLCSQEPIHAPGSIQPHGVLLVLQEPGLVILQASANTGKYLGIPPLELLGLPLSALLSPVDVALLSERLDPGQRESAPLPIKVRGPQGGRRSPSMARCTAATACCSWNWSRRRAARSRSWTSTCRAGGRWCGCAASAAWPTCASAAPRRSSA